MKQFMFDAFDTFRNQWALVTAGTADKFNTMTIGWGELGTLWRKPVATVYVRPDRYTYQFMESNEYFTISFFPEEYKQDLGTLGSHSGRDEDKIALTKLTPKFLENGVTFEQASSTLVCKKIYWHDLDPAKIPAEASALFYQNGEVTPHRAYIGEVVEIL